MAKKQNDSLIELSNFNRGGLAFSKWSGNPHSVYKMIGFDPHALPGILVVEQKLTAETTGTEPTELCKVAVNSSNGAQYWFSATTGKVWERPTTGTWRLVHTITSEAGAVICLGAFEFDGWIYVATQSRLHRISVALADDNNWATDFVKDWKPLNLDQDEIGGTGQTYALTTSIDEGATHRQTFTPANTPIESIAVNISAKGTTADWTLTVHDSANNSVGTSTILNANLAAGWIIFTLSASFTPTLGSAYHIHLVATNTTGTPAAVSNVASDLEGGNIRVYTTSNSSYHPMLVPVDTLYIGDNNFIHQVASNTDGSDTFTREALDIPRPLLVKSLGQIGTDLLIGTYVANTVTQTRIIRWNTWGESFTNSDPIPEVGINAFLPADNMVLVQAGLKGNIYWYDGEHLELHSKIPGEYSSTATAEVYPNSVANIEGDILFGFSNTTGNPADEGVYRIGRHSRSFDYIMDMPYPISERSGSDFVLTGLSIGAILVVGSDVYVAWQNGSTFGVDKTDASNKLNGAYIESRVMVVEREKLTNFLKSTVNYALLPSSTTIDMYLSKNYAVYGNALAKIDDTDRNIIESKDEGTVFTTLQFKFKVTTSANLAPRIESAGVFV